MDKKVPKKEFVPGRGFKEIVAKAHEKAAAKERHLTEEMRMDVLRYIAWFWPNPRISTAIFEKYKRKIVYPYQLINDYRVSEKWQPLIDKFREEYVATLSSVPLFHKKRRLEELQDMFDRYRAKGDDSNARQVLAAFREETEAKRQDLYLTQVNYNEFKSMTNEELEAEYSRLLEQKMRSRTKELTDQGGTDGMGS